MTSTALPGQTGEQDSSALLGEMRQVVREEHAELRQWLALWGKQMQQQLQQELHMQLWARSSRCCASGRGPPKRAAENSEGQLLPGSASGCCSDSADLAGHARNLRQRNLGAQGDTSQLASCRDAKAAPDQVDGSKQKQHMPFGTETHSELRPGLPRISEVVWGGVFPAAGLPPPVGPVARPDPPPPFGAEHLACKWQDEERESDQFPRYYSSRSNCGSDVATQESLPSLKQVNSPCTKRLSRESRDNEREEWNRHLEARMSESLCRMPSKNQNSRWAWARKEVVKSGSATSTSCMLRFVQGRRFEVCFAGIIIVNAAFIGYTSDMSMDLAMSDPPKDDPSWFLTCNTVFTALYVVELCLRICAHRCDFLFGDEGRWNLFDSSLVAVSLAEEIIKNMGLGSLRVIRGLRMVRVLRIIRVMRFFRDLRLMVCSIMQSLGSLSWAILLLVIIMYLFAVLFMQGVILHLRSEAAMDKSMVRNGVQVWYGSVFNTMYTLLAGITGGINWVEPVQPLEEISVCYRWLYAFYTVFVVIGVLNVLTGIFVGRASELSGLDRDLVIQSELKRNSTFHYEMRRIFEEADSDASGTISWSEFKNYLENDKAKAYLAAQQLDAFDARTLFDILNPEDREEISIEAFIVGCQRLKGLARSIDVVAVLHETRGLSNEVETLTRVVESMLLEWQGNNGNSGWAIAATCADD